MNQDTTINIRPEASIYGVFSRLNYKIWYAIAEFVDNSTASFFANERILKFYKINNCSIQINYDDENNTLSIIDDAYGMDYSDFVRAIKLDSKPEHNEGRNEFGMGLKTAASWFGNKWSVESTQFGSTKKYYALVDIHKLKNEHLNEVQIHTTECDTSEHGTRIIISDLTKKIEGGRTIGKIKNLLRSMFRRDINSGKVAIYFNGEKLIFEPYKTLEFDGRIWKKNIDFEFVFDEKKFKVTGFVGILGEGSTGFGRAGFALFRRNRIIIGGEDEYYKPSQIFIQAQSQISLKLYGELDVEDFPINQAKDGFIWDDGLETMFIMELKKTIHDYIEIAKKPSSILKTSETEKLPEIVEEIKAEINKSINELTHDNEVKQSNLSESIVEQYDTALRNHIPLETVLENTQHSFTIKINDFEEIIINVTWTNNGDKYWYLKNYNDANELDIKININHPFFEPFYHNKEFKEIIEKFIISFVIAIENSKRVSRKEGYIIPNDFDTEMNKILSSMSRKR